MAVAIDLQKETIREKTLEIAKRHKASWIELGQLLYTIHKDKHYKDWGFLTFEGYCAKELHIKQTTAAKLLKSYYFLEKEDPRLTDPSFAKEESPKLIPHPESVNLLRLVKNNKSLEPQDYAEIREEVLNQGREPKEVKAHVRKLLSEREVKDPAEVRRERRNAQIKRLVTMLSSVKREFESENLLPEYLFKQMGDLMKKLQDQLEE